MNQALFKKVYNAISARPHEFDMDTWEEPEAGCGTTRCLAGWAIFETTGQPLWDPKWSFNKINSSVYDYAESLGISYERDSEVEFDVLGLNALGLNTTDAWVFYTSRGKAREFARLASEGKFDEARALRNAPAEDYEDV